MNTLRVNVEDLRINGLDGGGIPIYYYGDQPFTGILYKNYEGSTTLMLEYEFNDGYEEGWQRFYFPNGKLECEQKVHNNELVNGTYKQWDESGQLIRTM